MKRDPFQKMLGNLLHSGKALRTTLAGKAKHPVEITRDDIEAQFDHQLGRCFWLGIKLDPYDAYSTHNMLAPSLDRLDITRGYVVDNFVVTCRFANLGRGAMEPDRFGEQIKTIRGLISNEMWPKYLFEELLTAYDENPIIEKQ